MQVTIVVDELEEVLAGEFLAALDDVGQPAVLQAQMMIDAVLATEVELDAAAIDPGVPVAQCGEAETLVVARIFFVADTGERLLQQLDESSQYPPALETSEGEVLVDLGADLGQDTPEDHHPAILRLVANRSPTGMVAVLFPGLLRRARSLAGGRYGPGRSRRPYRLEESPASLCA